MEVDLIPRLSLEFASLEEAWQFWVDYGGRKGFGARKHNYTKSKKDGSICSYRYVCCKEGLRRPDKRDFKTAKPRQETRTNCKARMSVARVNGKYKVNDFVEEHNHPLHPPETTHMLASQRKVTEVQAYEIDLAEDSGLQQKESFQLMSLHAGGRANLGYTRLDAKNYLNSKRQRSMMYGEAGCLLRYFTQQVSENPSFYHAYQMDTDEQITNVFWADARMLIDYAFFGDVVSLDTTYSTNRDHRPLAIFSGFNHYRGVIIFGAALLYDETTESFKWLLETFLEAHNQKRPQTVFTDQDAAMARALCEVVPDTKHGLCTWHLMQNGGKHLGNLMKDGSSFKRDFKKCMFEYLEETQFETAWNCLLSDYNAYENTWLKHVYKIKEKWAWCYMKNALTLGMRSTQLSESVNADIKRCTKPNLDINQFFTHFNRVVENTRYNELQRDFESRHKLPRLIVQRSPMLQQLAQIYTPPIFDLFQHEWDLHAAACIRHKIESQSIFEYVVGMVDEQGEWRVRYHPTFRSITCNCHKFETWGILCYHALKVYDMLDVKQLPDQYILNRWTREARSGIIYDIKGKEVDADLKLQSTHRYKQLCPMLVRLATEASDCEETFSLVHKGVLELRKQVIELRSRQQGLHNNGNTSTAPLMEGIVPTIGFKKRDGIRRKNRPKSCLERQPKKKRARTVSMLGALQRHQSMDNDMQHGVSSSAPPDCPQTYENELTYTEMLTAPFDVPMPSLDILEFSRDVLHGTNNKNHT